MAKDTITQLLEKVASGKVSVKDARVALEDASLTEEQMDAAINHGVFNPAEPGTIISASLAPSGNSALQFSSSHGEYSGHCTGLAQCCTDYSMAQLGSNNSCLTTWQWA